LFIFILKSIFPTLNFSPRRLKGWSEHASYGELLGEIYAFSVTNQSINHIIINKE